MEGKFTFTQATPLTLLVGGGGSSDLGLGYPGGGGGGSYVVNGATPLIIAGGGGGVGFNGDGDYNSSGGPGGPGGGGGADGIGTSGANCAATAGGSGGTDNSHVSGAGGAAGLGGGGGNPTGNLGGGGGGGGYYTSGGSSGATDGGGGGGGSIIDSSATADLVELSGIASPDGSPNGEIIITAFTPATITGISLSGANLTINGTNGHSGGIYLTLTSTNLSLPINQWLPVATNVLNAGGMFTFTATNAVNPADAQRFFRIEQTQ